MQDLFLIKMPLFCPKYKHWKRYGWRNAKEKENLIKTLTDSSMGYCMYCYRRVVVIDKFFGQIEHAIEKSNSQLLTECIPNMGIACPACNQSLKRIGEKNRKITEQNIKQFEENVSCRQGRK